MVHCVITSATFCESGVFWRVMGECGGYREYPTKGGIVVKYEQENEIAKNSVDTF